MPQHEPDQTTDDQANDRSRPSPQSDPTNPQKQETTGQWVGNERRAGKNDNDPPTTNERGEGSS